MLKSVVESLEGVDEPLRDYYEQDGEGYVLKTDQKDRIKDFRNNNIDLMKRLDALEAGLKKQEPPPKGDPPADPPKDTKKANNASEDAYTRQLQAMEQRLQETEQRLHRAEVRDKLVVFAGKHGMRPQEIEDAADKAASEFENVNGRLVRKRGEDVVFSEKNPAQPMEPDEYFESLAQQRPYLFIESTGGGAPGSRGNSNAKAPKVIPNDPVLIGQNAKGLRDGSVVIAGFES